MDQNGKCVILAVRIQQNHVPSELFKFEISDYYKSYFGCFEVWNGHFTQNGVFAIK